MKHWSALAMLLALVAALALRVPKLDLRPLHNDEAVNATKAAELWETGKYKYDPDEYHGPTLHYATVPFFWLSGAKNSDELKDAWLRAAPVAFGVALILLLPLFNGVLSRGAIAWSALFIAISPAMVSYSRYFIHEMLLVFFTALALGAGWRYTENPSPKWSALVGASVGLMFATKETFVITIGAIVVSAIAAHFWMAGRPAISDLQIAPTQPPISIWEKVGTRDIAMATTAFVVIWLLFFTSFLTNWSGLADSIKTYLPWIKRAGGHSPHTHPWYFYLERLAWFHPAKSPIWSEGLILILATIGGAMALLRRKSTSLCFLTMFTGALFCAYTIISYKTPWCLLNFHFGLILLAGVGAAELVKTKSWMALPILALAAQLTWQSYRANFVFSADRRNPYVYAQTVPDILNLVKKVEGIAAVAPNGFETVVKVITKDGDYWPLPWYLRRFKKIGWYEQLPDDPYAPIMIVSQKLEARFDEKSEKKWIMVGYTELRPQLFLEMYVELELWKKYVASLPPARDEE
jgi:uncharacterized protein (TIGR03663 family)